MKKTKKLIGGTNRLYELKEQQLPARMSNSPKSNSPKSNSSKSNKSNPKKNSKKTSLSKSALKINSSKKYNLLIELNGQEKIKKKVKGRFTKESFVYSDEVKNIETEVMINEKINDILVELNKIMVLNHLTDYLYLDKITLLPSNPSIADIIRDPKKYKYLKTTLYNSNVKGLPAILKILS